MRAALNRGRRHPPGGGSNDHRHKVAHHRDTTRANRGPRPVGRSGWAAHGTIERDRLQAACRSRAGRPGRRKVVDEVPRIRRAACSSSTSSPTGRKRSQLRHKVLKGRSGTPGGRGSQRTEIPARPGFFVFPTRFPRQPERPGAVVAPGPIRPCSPLIRPAGTTKTILLRHTSLTTSGCQVKLGAYQGDRPESVRPRRRAITSEHRRRTCSSGRP